MANMMNLGRNGSKISVTGNVDSSLPDIQNFYSFFSFEHMKSLFM